MLAFRTPIKSYRNKLTILNDNFNINTSISYLLLFFSKNADAIRKLCYENVLLAMKVLKIWSFGTMSICSI